MISLNSLSSLIDGNLLDCIKQYSIIEYICNTSKDTERENNLDKLSFMNSVLGDNGYIDITTNLINVVYNPTNGLEHKFLIYFSSEQGEILTSEMSVWDIEKILFNINIHFD